MDDVVVIGGGINSLVVAALLAKKKKSILLLESRDIIGGMATTKEFSPGFRCNMVYDYIRWIDPRLINELGLYKYGLEYRKTSSLRISLDENDSEFILMTKPIILGTKLMIEAIKQANADLAISGDSQSNGKLHQIKDFTPKAILKVKDIVNSGELKTKIKLENARLK